MYHLSINLVCIHNYVRDLLRPYSVGREGFLIIYSPLGVNEELTPIGSLDKYLGQ